MKSKHLYLVLQILLLSAISVHSQNQYFINVNQPLSLTANAGQNTSIAIGTGTQIGGSPSAANGYGGYLYSWDPITGLNDPSLSNPIASPVVTTTYTLHVTDSHGCAAESQVTITTYVDIDELTDFDFIKIYPNPTENILVFNFISFSGLVDIEIYDVLGCQLSIEHYKALQGDQRIIDIGNFANGIYMVLLRSDQCTEKKMILKH
ncbi:MAG: T9SS type A sorting domain-containing protein [Bacteroidia bacterium]|nr:T9SS type A sorting domain-containing protein [Bacteroidia bacterium]